MDSSKIIHKDNSNILHFNSDILLEKLGNNKEFFQEILKLGETDLNENKHKLIVSFKNNEIKEIMSTIHKLKGTAVSMNFEHLKTIIINFEDNSSKSSISPEFIKETISEIDYLLTIITKPV